jgi:hypothetical protein
LDARVNNPADGSIGDLFGQLLDDGRTLVRAEIDLYKEIALYRAERARTGIIALVAGGLLAYAGLIAALVGIVIGLTDMVGPIVGGLIVLLITGTAGFLLIRYGAKKISALLRNEDKQHPSVTEEPAA